MDQIADRYNPSEFEKKIYELWEKQNVFSSLDKSNKPPYCVILPPPNVTGSLHLGHALDHTVQDVLVRWHRMRGFNTNWLPGTDHAGIATQNVVEKELKKEGKTRHSLGREKFEETVWEWKEKFGNQIVEQMKRLGDSCDWNRFKFTLDESVSKAVKRVFVSLHREGLIYRGTRLVNWCTRCETAVSDLEVEHVSRKGKLWHIKYFIEHTSDFLIVATTRPETLIGDSAVCVNPNDERYKHLVGKQIILPLLKRKIPIIKDEYVDSQFGSGVVKITPAHDFNDYEIGKKHNLANINILTVAGLLNEAAGVYKDLNVQQARIKILEDLQKNGDLVKEENHDLNVGICTRCSTVIEPFLSTQWFMKMKSLAEPAKQALQNGSINFEPELWVKTFLHWMNNIEDWCISRQLWWGHRIPAYYCSHCNHINVRETQPDKCEQCNKKEFVQDEDVLDTWFSSGLWPFSTLGWPEIKDQHKTFYPTNTLVTGHDIIFFWVARMIMMGIKFNGDVPFRTVYFHGIIRDSQGRKMSKSLGNTIDPLDLIEKFGADALRFTLLSQMQAGRDIKFSEQRLEGYRNFLNKLWNATRFSLMSLKSEKIDPQLIQTEQLTIWDEWIIEKLKNTIEKANDHLSKFRFSDYCNTLYDFTWHDFCDWYLEFTKPILYSENEQRITTLNVLFKILNQILGLLHPIVPFITEEINQKLNKNILATQKFPELTKDNIFYKLGNEKSLQKVEHLKEIITAIRNIRSENQIKPKTNIQVILSTQSSEVGQIALEQIQTIMVLSNAQNVQIGNLDIPIKSALTPLELPFGGLQVCVPLEGVVDLKEEILRLNKLLEKNKKDLNLTEGKLSNENFIKNAPQELVEEETQRKISLLSKVQQIQDSIERLS